MRTKALSVIGSIVAVVPLAVVFINLSSEKKNQKLTPLKQRFRQCYLELASCELLLYSLFLL